MTGFELDSKVNDMLEYERNMLEYDRKIKQMEEATLQMKEFSESLKSITRKYEAHQVISYFNNLITANLPMSLKTTITAYLSQTQKLDDSIQTIDKLPLMINEILVRSDNSQSDSKKYDSKTIIAYFKYIQNSPNYLNVFDIPDQNLKNSFTLSEKVEKFNLTLTKLKKCFTENNITKDVYELDITARDLKYFGKWEPMIEDLIRKIDEESKKADKNEQKILEFNQTKKRAQELGKIEKEEKADLSVLSKISHTLYKALNL